MTEDKPNPHIADIHRYFGYLGEPDIEKRGENLVYLFSVDDAKAQQLKQAVGTALTSAVTQDVARRSAKDYEGDKSSPFAPLPGRLNRNFFDKDVLFAYDNPDPRTRRRELAISADLMEAIHINMEAMAKGVDVPARVPFRQDFLTTLEAELYKMQKSAATGLG